MSVLIRGMKMPKNCWECALQGNPALCIEFVDFSTRDERPEQCPLVEVPATHGRLIDADALIADIRANSESYFADNFIQEWVDVAPTIIPAEEDER